MEATQKTEMRSHDLSRFRGQPWSSWITNQDMTTPTDLHSTQVSKVDSKDLSQFRGQPWSSWITNLDMATLSNSAVTKLASDCRVTRLPRKDMGLFGICPENDRFCAVLCTTCGAVVKPQGLQRHLELKHTSDSESALLPPPQVPVKKNKTSSAKTKNKESVPVQIPVHSSENIVPSFQPVISTKSLEALPTPTNTKTILSKVTNLTSPLESESSTYSHAPRRKSPNIGSDRKSQQKNREKDSDNEKNICRENKQINSQQLSSKSHLASPRRTVTGRTKDFNKLVAEHRATKEQPITTTASTSSKSRAQSILKTAVAPQELSDSGFSSSNSSLSSLQSTLQDSLPLLDTSPLQASPSSPTLPNVVTASTGAGTGTGTPTVTSCPVVEHQHPPKSPSSSASSSPSASAATSVSAPTDTEAPATPFLCAQSVRSSPTSIEARTPPQLVHVVPTSHGHASPHVYTVKLPCNPVFILNSSKEPATPAPIVPSVNLNVNTESISSCTAGLPEVNVAPISPQSQPVMVSRDVIESLNVPVVMEMPTLPDSLTNITVYTSYPKPLVVSTFSAKKVGHAVVFSNRRLDFIRSQFKSVLKKGRRVNMSMKTGQTVNATPAQQVFGVKTLNAAGTCRFPKTGSVPSVQATSLLAHRPNILRTTAPKQPREHVPKILTTGLKRPASSSPQLANLDCKHMLLKPTGSNLNVNGIIGKMIVHQHEVTEAGEGPNTNHLALDKVVPVNIK